MKAIVTSLTMVCSAAALMIVLTGCQTAGGSASAGSPEICPHCKAQTSVLPCKNVTYTKAVCPHCGKMSALSPTLRDAVRSYVGVDASGPVHVCHNCKCVVENCPVCRGE